MAEEPQYKPRSGNGTNGTDFHLTRAQVSGFLLTQIGALVLVVFYMGVSYQRLVAAEGKAEACQAGIQSIKDTGTALINERFNEIIYRLQTLENGQKKVERMVR